LDNLKLEKFLKSLKKLGKLILVEIRKNLKFKQSKDKIFSYMCYEFLKNKHTFTMMNFYLS